MSNELFKKGDIITLPEQRTVLFEKYSKQIDMEMFFNDGINGCNIVKIKIKSKSSIYFIKDNFCKFEFYRYDSNTKNKEQVEGLFYINGIILHFYERYFNLTYKEVVLFVEQQMRKIFNLNFHASGNSSFECINEMLK